MEFYNTRKPAAKRRNIQQQLADFTVTEVTYALPINMYSEHPTEEIKLAEFKEFALKRRSLLKEIEYINGKYQKLGEDWKQKLREISKTYKLHVDRKDDDNQEIRRRDYISHFLLRLSYSQNQPLRKWMLTHETDLFRYRFENASEAERFEFMSLDPDLKTYTQLTETELSSVKQSIQESYIKFLRDRLINENTKFYKVPFHVVPHLMASRSIFIQNGFAYLPSWDLQTIVASVFRSKLSHALTVMSMKLDKARDDERIWKFLCDLDNYYEGPDYKGSSKRTDEKIGVDDIEDLYKDSFPLCMVNLHTGLRREHHMKHWGRMQYGLYLKGIGVGLDDSLRFWREEFTKLIDSDKFDKEYAYNIRHHYGQEGRRTSYSAYSCSKIINNNPPGALDNHGCPYRHFDKANLKKLLSLQGVKDKPLRVILELAEQKQYNNACLRYFETKHDLEETSLTIDHPNKYFMESRYLQKGNRPQMRIPPPAPVATDVPVEMETENKVTDEIIDTTLENFENFDDDL